MFFLIYLFINRNNVKITKQMGSTKDMLDIALSDIIRCFDCQLFQTSLLKRIDKLFK